LINVRILSGEDSVRIEDTLQLISFRGNYDQNELASRYIIQKLESFNYQTEVQLFGNYGKNIFAVKYGSVYPKRYYILGAHYDAVDYFCADDNASGTAAVLEAARVLKEYSFEYSVIFVFFDEEEIGLMGSKYFAANAYQNGMEILGVINLDMIAWDSDNDNDFEIHSNLDDASLFLADSVTALTNILDIPLDPTIYRNGTDRSDHASFWEYDYPAVLMIEEIFGDDFNPFYHSADDRIGKFNLEYFHNMSKLAAVSIASLASSNIPSELYEQKFPDSYSLDIKSYPNPFNGSTNITFSLPGTDIISINLYNTIGERIDKIYFGIKDKGNHVIEYDNGTLNSGIYFLILKTSNSWKSHKIVLIK
jgi:hypothetical protein